jgi:UDP-hydrolysing UDP-N-acetyl-D-glucosamine 2-epimerase
MQRKVCIVTSNRADWGLLLPVARLLAADPEFTLQVLVTGQHLDDKAGRTVDDIRAAGFTIDATVDMALTGDDAMAVTSGLARAIDGIGRALAQLRPDLVMVLGDRYEILGAAMTASLARIPIAHLCGGDVTEGAMDDAFRHAITKLSHLHFVTNADAAQRVAQMGEPAERIFNVGSTGIDNILATPILPRGAFFASVEMTPRAKNIICTFHPETLEPNTGDHCRAMLQALDKLGEDVGLLFTGANNDVEGSRVNQEMATFVAQHKNSRFVPSLGSQRYFSALSHMDIMVGNSSSGVYEAPSFGIPTVNIGGRQAGRLRASTVIDTVATAAGIADGITKAFEMPRTQGASPYGDGQSTERVVKVIKGFDQLNTLTRKSFANARSTK